MTPIKPPAETVADAGVALVTTPATPIRPAAERATATSGAVRREKRERL